MESTITTKLNVSAQARDIECYFECLGWEGQTCKLKLKWPASFVYKSIMLMWLFMWSSTYIVSCVRLPHLLWDHLYLKTATCCLHVKLLQYEKSTDPRLVLDIITKAKNIRLTWLGWGFHMEETLCLFWKARWASLGVGGWESTSSFIE